jgi:triacylglycerol lipase
MEGLHPVDEDLSSRRMPVLNDEKETNLAAATPGAGFSVSPILQVKEVLALAHAVKYAGRPIRQPANSDGAKVPVLIVPGIVVGDWFMTPLRRHLRRAGHITIDSQIVSNIRCSEAALERLELILEAEVAKHGRPIAIVGYSRGGMFGRALSTRRPDLVAGLITLASPLIDATTTVSPVLLRPVGMMARLNRTGSSQLMSDDCLTGECYERTTLELAQKFPHDIPFTSVVSSEDGFVERRAMLDPDAQHVEVRAGHLNIVASKETFGVIDTKLAEMPAAKVARRAAS